MPRQIPFNWVKTDAPLFFPTKGQEFVPLSDEIKKLRRLVRYLNTLINSRAREKTRLHSVKDNDVADVLKGTIKFMTESITQVEKT